MASLMQGLGWMLLSSAFITGSCCAVPTDLDLSLMKELTSNLGENVAISPFVMSTLMTQAWLAAKGTTRDEMSPVLGVSDDSFLPAYQAAIGYLTAGTSTVDTRVFNGIYLKTGFSIKPNYTSVLATYYSASVKTFSTPNAGAAAINSAVAAATNNLIPNLVTSAALRNALFVLVSALFFKGDWQTRFNRTEPEQFLTASGEKTVNMMKLETRVPYKNMGTYDAISLLYKDPDYSMLLLRPRQRTMAAVQALRNSLDSLNVASIMSQLNERKVNVAMPRFKIEAEYNLESIFPVLGIKQLFTSTADLGNMLFSQLKVDQAIHKVVIEVTEQGTEAAGAGALIGVTSAPPSFTLDRPFFAIVWNKQHINMFTAYVGSP